MKTTTTTKWDSTALASFLATTMLVQCFSVVTPVVKVRQPNRGKGFRELAKQSDFHLAFKS